MRAAAAHRNSSLSFWQSTPAIESRATAIASPPSSSSSSSDSTVNSVVLLSCSARTGGGVSAAAALQQCAAARAVRRGSDSATQHDRHGGWQKERRKKTPHRALGPEARLVDLQLHVLRHGELVGLVGRERDSPQPDRHLRTGMAAANRWSRYKRISEGDPEPIAEAVRQIEYEDCTSRSRSS